jgi:hypothetical protein
MDYESQATLPNTHTNTSGGPAEVMLMTKVKDDEYTHELMGYQFYQQGTSNQDALSQTNSKRSTIPDSWILLDNQSTIDVFTNRKLLKNIRKVDEVMDIQLDIVNDTNMDRQDGKMELIDMIADNMVSSLLEGNCIQADSKSYKYIETIKGRIVVKITKIIMYGNEPESETKSYFPSKLKDIFRSSAHKKADTLIKN